MPGSAEVIVKIHGGDPPPPPPASAATPPSNTSLDHATSSMQQREFIFHDDPPSKLIGQFLNRQKASGGEMTLDMDMEMDDQAYYHNFSPANSNQNNYVENNRNSPASKEPSFSFQAPKSSGSNVVDIGAYEQKEVGKSNGSPSSDEDESHKKVHDRKRLSNAANNVDVNNDNGSGEDCRLSRRASVQKRFSNLGRLQTKSRLMDPHDIPDRRSGMNKSGQIRSGMLDMPVEDEEDDPLFGEDFPEDYKKAKFDALTVAQWISLILLVTALVCTLAVSKWKRKNMRGLSLWKWELLVLVLICGRLVSGWGIRIVVFFIERNFFMRKRILYFVYGVRKAVQNCIWLGLVLISWHYMLDQKIEKGNKFLQYVNKLMVCLLVGTLLWLVKTLMVKVLASSFHVSTFFNRIQESLFNQYVIETLSGPPLVEIRNHQEEEDRTLVEVWRHHNAGATLPPDLRPPVFQPMKSEKFVGTTPGGFPTRATKGASDKISGTLPKNQDDQGISIDHLHRLNNKNISAWNMKRLINRVKNGVLSTLDEQVMDTSRGDEATTQIRSECEAKVAARKIFQNVTKPKAKFIYLKDLMRFMREEEALKTLNVVEGSTESERISKASLKNWVVNAFRERKALALTLNDAKTAVKKLHQMVNAIIGITIFIIWLVILEVATSKFLLFLSSQIVVVAFVFGNTCKIVFEAVIFVFVMHPFDVGDRCEVDGVQMIVEEMNILTTIFLRFDNQKILYPNVTLATKPISNFYRSPDMGDSVEFAVHVTTPAEKIALIKQRITIYIENKSEYWYPSPSVVLMNLENLHTLKMSVWLRHRMNHQNMGERWKRRALLVEEMVRIFKDLDIEYRLHPLDINVRAMPPLNSTRIHSAWPPPLPE
ncbi:mechanosensitive ion channel protein 8-like [Henckelia pumila]|uniref:mechanosensitive ion channel protein 8-like n=1 Tax=Henckelia pumila TaxID=405737 RepID=UPI003C6E385E